MAFQKRWPVMRGKMNMICKEWCEGNGPNFATLMKLSWPFRRGPTVYLVFLLSMKLNQNLNRCSNSGLSIHTGASNVHHCDAGTEAQFDLNCHNNRVIRVGRVYFGTTTSLTCPPPISCGTYDDEATERLQVNCNGLPTCTAPANFPRVKCEREWVNTTSLFVTYDCVLGKQFCSCLGCENYCFHQKINLCRVNFVQHVSTNISFLKKFCTARTWASYLNALKRLNDQNSLKPNSCWLKPTKQL